MSAGDESGASSGAPGLPAPRVKQRAHFSLWVVWLVPVIAVVIGLWLGVKSVLAHGPTVVIHFRNAEGLEAGKTKIRYKAVDIGVVKTIALTPDRKSVAVTAELNNQPGAREMLVSDTKFWVVRPQVTAGGISGLGTLLSGAYIGVDIGRSTELQDSFDGLEVPPVVTGDLPGRSFKLRSPNLGSLDVGSPIYYRRVPVGQVISYDLAPNGKQVVFGIFINAPYDRFVTARSRFWQASGIDIAVNADGVRVTTESLASLVTGGIAFEELPGGDEAPLPEMPANAEFMLGGDRALAMKQPDRFSFDYTLLFSSSVRGLSIGAPVDFRGLSIGEVTDIQLASQASPDNPVPQIAVTMRVYPRRLPTLGARPGAANEAPPDQVVTLNPMVQRGFRAQLRNGNLLTGQLYVALDFFPRAPEARIDWAKSPAVFPTLPGSLEGLQDTLTSIADKLDRLPLEDLAKDLRQTLASVNQLVRRADGLVQQVGTDVTPQAVSVLAQARKTLDALNSSLQNLDQNLDAKGPLQSQALKTMTDLSTAARSLRVLADTLEQHPESLLRGKPGDKK